MLEANVISYVQQLVTILCNVKGKTLSSSHLFSHREIRPLVKICRSSFFFSPERLCVTPARSGPSMLYLFTHYVNGAWKSWFESGATTSRLGVALSVGDAEGTRPCWFPSPKAPASRRRRHPPSARWETSRYLSLAECKSHIVWFT